MTDQSNQKWRYDRIRRLYIEGYGIPWIRRHSPSSSDTFIARAIQLPYMAHGPVQPLALDGGPYESSPRYL